MSAKRNIHRMNTSGDSDEIISAKSFLMASLSVFFLTTQYFKLYPYSAAFV